MNIVTRKNLKLRIFLFLVAIIVIEAGVFSWIRIKTPAENITIKNLNTTSATTPIAEPIAVESSQKTISAAKTSTETPAENNIFISKEFGFQTKFPNSWIGRCKYEINHFDTGSSILLLLPTSDKDWLSLPDTKPGGYVAIGNLLIETFSEYQKGLDANKNRQDDYLEEVDMNDLIIGKTNKYIVLWGHPDDSPSDFAQYYTTEKGIDWVDYMKQNFEEIK
jgi:hypothetical protein